MGMGKPVVASRIGDIPLILGDDGYLVEPGDPKEIAKTLKYIYGNPSEAAEKAKALRRKAEENYGWDRISKTLLKAYRGGRE